MTVWIDGRFVPIAEAKVSLFDAGIQHGVGLFETMCARHGRVFRVMEHLDRLQASAKHLGLVDMLRIEPLAEAIALTVAQNHMESARVRLTVTAGDLKTLKSLGVPGDSPRGDPTIAIVVQPPTSYPTELFDRGVRARVADGRVNQLDPFAGHKTLWYWPRLAELQRAAAHGCSESIFFTANGRVASGAVSNVFVVHGGKLRTPWAQFEGDARKDAPVLPGVTRGAVLECASKAGIVCESVDLTIDDLLGADEVFLTNSSFGVLPVVGIEQREIGGHAPGPITKRLRADYLALVESETA
ncbi:MAG: hypothetical protein EXS01_03610 [Phycisphaerales bacterium]|nr:hypothetical protein [Phycisphaerales bacterium]